MVSVKYGLRISAVGEILPRLTFREQDVGREPDAVAHRHHHIVFAVGVLPDVGERGGVS
jgi:hypothetical protein